MRAALSGVAACLLLACPRAGNTQQPTDAEAKALERSMLQDAQTLAPAVTPTESQAPALADANPNLSMILDTAAAYWSSAQPLESGGHDPVHSGFNLQQLELHYDSNVDPYLRLDANLVFGRDGFELEEAYASTLALPGRLRVRAGQFLTPFGRLNPAHPHSWSFVDQPLVNGRLFGPDGSRGLGTEVSWLAPLPWYLETFLAANQPAGPTFAYNHEVRDGTDLLYTGALKQFWPLGEDWGLLFGLSTQQGPQALSGHAQVYGADLNLRWRPVDDPRRRSVTLQAEAMLRVRETPTGPVRDGGGYVQLVAALDPRWEVGLREERVQGDPLDPQALFRRSRHAAQLTFFPSHFSRLRLQGQVDSAAWLPERIWGVMLALEIVVGAHGAHAY
jgi:hypothetical protein